MQDRVKRQLTLRGGGRGVGRGRRAGLGHCGRGLASDRLEEIGTVALEEAVRVDPLVPLLARLLEVVEVELPYEALCGWQ